MGAWVELKGIRGLPKWVTRLYVEEETIYFPAAMVGKENTVLLAAAYDGTPMVSDSGHVYLPDEWLVREYPEHARRIALLTVDIRQSLRPQGEESSQDESL